MKNSIVINAKESNTNIFQRINSLMVADERIDRDLTPRFEFLKSKGCLANDYQQMFEIFDSSLIMKIVNGEYVSTIEKLNSKQMIKSLDDYLGTDYSEVILYHLRSTGDYLILVGTFIFTWAIVMLPLAYLRTFTDPSLYILDFLVVLLSLIPVTQYFRKLCRQDRLLSCKMRCRLIMYKELLGVVETHTDTLS